MPTNAVKKWGLFLLLFLPQNMHMYSQELQWQEKDELIKALYQSMESFVNESPYVKVKPPRIFKVGPSLYFKALSTKKERQKSYTEQKQLTQANIKNILDTHFVTRDSILEFVFQDKEQIIKWAKAPGAFVPVQSEEFRIKDANIFILQIDPGSGMAYQSIYVFKEKENLWQLITGTHIRVKEVTTINNQEREEEIRFETTSGKVVCKLPYDVLDED